jgi:hypothetical protein
MRAMKAGNVGMRARIFLTSTGPNSTRVDCVREYRVWGMTPCVYSPAPACSNSDARPGRTASTSPR